MMSGQRAHMAASSSTLAAANGGQGDGNGNGSGSMQQSVPQTSVLSPAPAPAPNSAQTTRHSSSSSSSPSTRNKGPPKGFSRVAPMRKIVDAFVKRSRLEITSLHISQPDASGMCAKGKIRLTHLGTGPFPLVGLRVKFKDPKGASLHWSPLHGSSLRPDQNVVQVMIEPITLQPSTPGSVKSEIDMRFVLQDDTQSAFIDFVRHIIRSDPKHGTRILMKAVGVQVKAFGLRFGDLKLEKDVVLGGLGCLGGILDFQQLTPTTDMATTVQKTNSTTVGANGSASVSTQRKKRLSLPRRLRSSSSKNLKAAHVSDSLGEKAPAMPQAKKQNLQIEDLDIIGGDAKLGIQVAATVTIENPAREPELIVEPGELHFALCVSDNDSEKNAEHHSDTAPLPADLIQVGKISLSSTVLRPGLNKVKAMGHLLLPTLPEEGEEDGESYTARAYRAGQRLLRQILQNESVNLSAVAPSNDNLDGSGLSAVSSVGWLAAAFQGTRINAYIPPLGDRVKLLDGAEVRVEGNDGLASPIYANDPPALQNSVARATLRNGFNADIHVYDLRVSARSAPLVGDDGVKEILELGTLYSPHGTQWTGLTLQNGTPAHVSLPMEINPDPRVLIEILRKSARSRNISLGNPLTELLEDLRFAHWNQAGFTEPPKSRASSSNSRRTSMAAQSVATSDVGEAQPSDDLAALLANALANMRVTAHIEAIASIGNYALPGKLTFEQRDLPIALSTATAAALLPLVGKPFVKAMVDRAEIEVQSIKVLRLHDRGIDTELTLQLLNFGPLSAEAEFDQGLHLRDDNGRTVAIIHFDGPLAVQAGSYEPVKAEARIVPPPTSKNSTDVFSDFVSQLLRSDHIAFNALADPISITSGGVHFRSSLEKEITVSGLGGFRGLRMTDLQILGEASAPAAGVSFSVAAPANPSQPTAITFSTSAQIDNQGVIFLSIKKLEVAVAVDGVQIGQASIDDLDLQPGKTANVRVKGIIYTPPARQEAEAHQAAVGKVSRVISSLLAGKPADIQILGRRAWVMSDSSRPVSLAWLDAALRTFSTSASIQWKDGVQIVTGIDVGKIEATFAARKELQLRIEEVVAQYSVPFPVQFDLQAIDATMDIMFGGKVIANCHAAQDSIEHIERSERRPSNAASAHKLPHRSSLRLQPPSSPTATSFTGRTSSSVDGARLERHPSNSSLTPSNAEHASPYAASRRNSSTPSPSTLVSSLHSQNQTGKVKLSLKAFELKTQNDDDLLGDMIAHIVEAGPEGTEKITLRGVAHARVKTPVGVLSLTVPLGVEHKLDISGLDGLRNSPVHYTDFEIVSANSKYIQIMLNIQSHNPSQAVTILVPDSSLSMGAYYNDAFLGDVIIGSKGDGITIKPGHVALDGVEFRFRPTSSSEEKIRPVLTKLFTGESVHLMIRGHRKSSVNAALSQALRTVSVPIEISPLGNSEILEKIRVQLGMNVITSNTIDAKYVLNNPINLPIDILHMDVQAYYDSKPFGNASKSFQIDGTPIGRILPPEKQKSNESPMHDSAPESSGNTSKRASMSRSRGAGGQGNPQRLHIQGGARRFEGDLVVKLQQAPDQLVKAFLAERGSIVLDVDVTIKADVQGYVIPHFAYRQKVPLEVSGLQGIARLLRLV